MNNTSKDNDLLRYGSNILISADEPIPRAIEAVLSLLDLSKIPETPQKIGITAAHFNNDNYRNNLIKLLDGNCNLILVLWFGKEDKDDEWNKAEWNSLAGSILQKVSGFIGLIDALNSPYNTQEWRHDRLLQKLQAKAVYSLLKEFGHNSKSDITNGFLAPIRMLLCENDIEGALSVWRSPYTNVLRELFVKYVCSNIDKRIHGHLGSMICDYMTGIINSFNDLTNKKNNSKETIQYLEQMMTLLTECRIQAGESVSSSDTSISNNEITPGLGRYDSVRRILIIDDDISSWKPVLNKIKGKLDKEVELYVSPNASGAWPLDSDEEDSRRNGTYLDVGQCLPDFDLLLLDIYLKDEENGLKLLGKIRSRIMHLPVILWTTSTEKELPSQAALANGFLFKKTATIASISSKIQTWLSAGMSQRLWSLPNPFFDYSLRDPDLREVALAFTKWTLRYMDCFHAVDHFYFKYFNDHGGRHILGVLDTTAKLLRPFLFEEGETTLFSKDTKIRNQQLFCLYIAILCHEFGMFPIYKGEHPPECNKDYDTKTWEQMVSIRKLHAARGMLMILEKPNEVTSHFDVNGCQSFLENLDKAVGEVGRNAVALLVGYHQRCLDLKKSEISYYNKMDKFTNVNEGAKEKVDVAAATGSGNWTSWDAVSEASTIAWQKVSGDKKKDNWDIDRVRKLCAILRFADALDVDHTRVPADFLLKSDNRTSIQDIEDCKRQVLAAVQIDKGRVSLEFFAPTPNKNWVDECATFSKEVFNNLKVNSSVLKGKEKEDFLLLLDNKTNSEKDKPFFEELLRPRTLNIVKEDLFGLFKKPWAFNTHLKNIEKYLKGCLQLYFIYHKFKNVLSYNIDAYRETMATAATILVILEIKDEYIAIKDVKLRCYIKLASVKWLAGPLPSILELKT